MNYIVKLKKSRKRKAEREQLEKEKLEKEMLAKINKLNEDKKNVSRVIDEMKDNLKGDYLKEIVLPNEIENYLHNFIEWKFKSNVCKRINKLVIGLPGYTEKLKRVLRIIKDLNNQINNKQSGGAYHQSIYDNIDNTPKLENKENNKTEQELKKELEKEETEYNDTFSNIKHRIFDLLP